MKISQNLEDWLWAVLAAIALVLMVFFYTPRTHAQNVVRNGKVFVQSPKDSTKTDYEYQDKDGNKYPIYLSSNKKAYIWVYSTKKQKWYRRYLPKITEMLKEADNGK